MRSNILTKNPSISIIIPNLHSPIIDKVVNAVLEQEYSGKIEIIVVGMDKFHLLSQFKGNEHVKILVTDRPMLPAVARNIGIRESQGEFVVFLDADCIVNLNWLKHLMDNYKDGTKWVVGGAFDLSAYNNFWTLCDNLGHFSAVSCTRKKGKVRGLLSANLSIPRNVLTEIGFFDETFVTGEDRDFCMRIRCAGFPLIFEPSARVKHYPQRKSFFSILRHSYSWGLSSLKVRMKYSNLEPIPWVMRTRIRLLLFTPLIAAVATVNVFLRSPSHLTYIYTFPLIFCSKIAWCIGAFRSLRN